MRLHECLVMRGLTAPWRLCARGPLDRGGGGGAGRDGEPGGCCLAVMEMGRTVISVRGDGCSKARQGHSAKRGVQ